MNIVEIARLFSYVREAQEVGQNRGLRVEAIQHWAGGQQGDSWCMEFVWMVLDIAFKGKAPIQRTQSCQSLHKLAKSNGWIVANPQPGDLFLYVNPANWAHHVGIVTEINPLVGIAGNTSSDGRSSNGNGVYEHAISASTFVRLPSTYC